MASHPPPNVLPHNSQLSLFEQTLLENDEVFYKTFPAARMALEHNTSPHVWRPRYETIDFAGCGFQLDHIPPHDQPSLISPGQSLPQSSPHSPSSYPVDGIHVAQHPAHPHPAQFEQNCPMDYPVHHVSSADAHHESLSNAAHPPLHIATSTADIPYPARYHQSHQQALSSPVMDSLSSPQSSSDPSNALYHTPPQHVYYATPPFNANPIPSPIHRGASAPLTPPALVPATYIKPEPEQQSFPDTQPSPQRPSLVLPSRRNSQQQIASHRSKRRFSPQYNRPSHQSHRSGGSGGTHPVTLPNMGWPPTPSPTATTPSRDMNVGININVGPPLVVNPVNTTAAVAPTGLAVTVPASVALASASSSVSTALKGRPLMSSSGQVPGASNLSTGVMSGKRNPDKKPALACVFCRGRKIACGPPLKDGDGKTCNQCQRRSLRCEYPTESRRGMRKKPSSNSTASPTSTSTSTSTKGNSKHNTNAAGNPKPNANPDSPKMATNRKR